MNIIINNRTFIIYLIYLSSKNVFSLENENCANNGECQPGKETYCFLLKQQEPFETRGQLSSITRDEYNHSTCIACLPNSILIDGDNVCWDNSHMLLDHESKTTLLYELFTEYNEELEKRALFQFYIDNAKCYRTIQTPCMDNSNDSLLTLNIENLDLKRMSSFLLDNVYNTISYFQTDPESLIICEILSLVVSVFDCVNPYEKEIQYITSERKEKLILSCIPLFSNATSSEYMWFAIIAFIISSVFLSLHIIGSIVRAKLRQYPHNLILGIAITVLMVEISYLIITHVNTYQLTVCFVLYFIYRFSRMIQMIWMLIVAFDTWSNVVEILQGKAILRKSLTQPSIYITFTIITSLMITVIDILVLKHTKKTNTFHYTHWEGHCYLSGFYSNFVFYMIPLLIILICNITFFGLTMYRVKTTKNAIETPEVMSKKLHILWKLSFLIGLPWIFDFVSDAVLSVHMDSAYAFSYIAIFLLGLQGPFIFIFYTLTVEMRQTIKNKILGFFGLNAQTDQNRLSRQDSVRSTVSVVDLNDK